MATRRDAREIWQLLRECHDHLLLELRQAPPLLGLTVPQFEVLLHLSTEEVGTTPGRLARKMRVTAGNLTGVFRRLERRGLIRRQPHPLDRRVAVLRLTSDGRRLARRGNDLWDRLLQGRLRFRSRQEIGRLRGMLERLGGRLNGTASQR